METGANLIHEWNSEGGRILKKDRDFLEKLISLINDNIASKDLNVEFIEKKMNITHSTLYRKIKRLTGMSSRDFLMKQKMDYCVRLLDEGRNVSEAAYGCGFNDPGYFRQCFKKMYGLLPSRYIKQIRSGDKIELSSDKNQMSS